MATLVAVGASPALSPNGRYLAWISWNAHGFYVAVDDLRSRRLQRVTSPLFAGGDHVPPCISWSPNSDTLAILLPTSASRESLLTWSRLAPTAPLLKPVVNRHLVSGLASAVAFTDPQHVLVSGNVPPCQGCDGAVSSRPLLSLVSLSRGTSRGVVAPHLKRVFGLCVSSLGRFVAVVGSASDAMLDARVTVEVLQGRVTFSAVGYWQAGDVAWISPTALQAR
jgi:hypothetical protein